MLLLWVVGVEVELIIIIMVGGIVKGHLKGGSRAWEAHY
jgi:hypothetical protein